MPEIFELLDKADVWESDPDGFVWAINYRKAAEILTAAGIKGIDGKIAFIADYYGVDVD